MASLILLIVLAVYCIWSLRRMVKRRKENRGKCAGCPYQGTGMCRSKLLFAQVEEPFSQMEGYRFKALTRTVFLHMMKIQLNNDLIV